MAKYDKNNCECPDTTPLEIPIGYTEPETMAQMIARIVQSNELAHHLHMQGIDTLEEADDFDVDDELPIKSEHEMVDMLDEFIQEKIMPEATATTVPETKAEVPPTK